ncbi:MAG: YmfQ family protein, partial [Clostridiales bacterium]|nr:YmfQ family protein [Clostridiales bacterium]
GSATWGLVLWEKALGIDTDVSKSNEYRRTRIMSKLRGSGTTTADMIKNVAESFSNGIVDVIEHPEQYSFDIKFVGTLGIPPNMDDLTAAVEEIKPAHLAYTFVYIYRTYGGLKPYTHLQLSNYTHSELRNRGDI